MKIIGGIKGETDTSKLEELLKLVGLGSTGNKKVKQFSLGMKQRLGIAQALLNRPRLLICDEPTSALDPVGRKEILDLLLAVREQTTVLFSTHITSDLERCADNIVYISQGIIRESCSKTDFLQNNGRTGETLEEIFLRMEREGR